jgi:signal transduction histidine kinase
VKSSLTTMNRQVKKLTRLVRELLELSRIQTNRQELHRSSFLLFQLAEEVVQDARLTTSRNPIIFRYDYNGPVFADRDRLGQVMTNLLSHAIKYSKDGGTIEVVLRKENGLIIFSVCDEGIGISKKEQNRIFDRFYRATGKSEQTYPGFGVGLFIAREIVKSHGGRIKVDSQKGKGSTFTVILPLESVREGVV